MECGKVFSRQNIYIFDFVDIEKITMVLELKYLSARQNQPK